MTLFEYLAGAYVLMLSLALLRAISGVPHALSPGRRYWIHASWLVIALTTCLVAFWLFWPYRNVEWTIFRFMSTLAVPALLYGFIAVLVPPDPAAVSSWRAHYYEARVRQFGAGAAFIAAVIVSNQCTLGVSPLHVSQLGNYFLLAILLVGVSTPRPPVHAVLVLGYALLTTFFLLTLLVEPDSLFRASE